MEENNHISAGTIARTIALLLALVNQGLTIAGISPIPIEDETVVDLVSLVFTVIAAIVAWWKNNSFTKAAIAGDKVMRRLKGDK